MADLRFNVDQAVEQLQAETKRATERLAETSAALERELRAVAAGGAIAGAGWDIAKADAFHVLEIDTTAHGTMPLGGELELTLYGRRLGASKLARPFEPGLYRVVIQITRSPLHCTRCGMEGHERSPPGQPAGDNCREAIGQSSSRRP